MDCLLGFPGPSSVTGAQESPLTPGGPEGPRFVRRALEEAGLMLREAADIGDALSSHPGAWPRAEASAVFYFGVGMRWSG